MFIVSTQVLENYGAHSEDGKFSSGNHYWKFKAGSEYLVEDLDREQDAMAVSYTHLTLPTIYSV